MELATGNGGQFRKTGIKKVEGVEASKGSKSGI
jgi:hypothetical protein